MKYILFGLLFIVIVFIVLFILVYCLGLFLNIFDKVKYHFIRDIDFIIERGINAFGVLVVTILLLFFMYMIGILICSFN